METLTFVNALMWLASAACAGVMAYGAWLAILYTCGSSRRNSNRERS